MGEYNLRIMVCDRCGAKQEAREEKELKGWNAASLIRTGAKDNPFTGVQEEYQYREEKVLCPRCLEQKIEMWREYNGKLITWFEEGVKIQGEGGDNR